MGLATPITMSGPAFAERLRGLAERDTRGGHDGVEPPFISAFVSRRRENVAAFATPVTGLVVVVQGRKQVRCGAFSRSYGPGEALLLVAGSRVDVVNEPDAVTGTYRALFLRFPRDLVIEAARLWPEFVGRSERGGDVSPTAALCDAILHAGAALAGASRRVLGHRVLEVMLILAEQGALRLTPKYVEGSLAEAVRLLVRHKLDRDWSAAKVAASFGLSQATLRRRLRQQNLSLRDLLLSERMQAARILLCDRDADVAEALAATGYASRSHFARHFRRTFGLSPVMARMRRSVATSA